MIDCRDLIAGAFVSLADDQADALIERESPADFGVLASRARVRSEHVDRAVAAARQAFQGFAELGLDARAGLLRALRDAIAANEEHFVEQLVREVGKPRWDARTEVAAALAKVDITLSDGRALIEPRQMGSRALRYQFRPHGVGAVIGPFNFPLHLLHGHVVPALLAGNTLVIKPSEQAPGVGQLYAECLREAGFPPGVVNLVQGDGRAGERLAAHPDVDLVMFTGSYPVGQAIRRATLEQPHKLLALEMGGRNPAIVLADANPEKAAHDIVWGATVTAGQRCSGTAVALVERGILEPFLERLARTMEGLRLGHPADDGVFMGPLIHERARADYLARLAQAEAQGASRVDARRQHPLLERGAYVAPSLHYVEHPGTTPYETEELFGPDLAVEAVCDLEHAVERANAGVYGLSCSLFGADPGRFEWALHRLRYGVVNHNAPTCGASSRLPFGGLKRSGNHRPAALFSTLYAATPVATIEGADNLDSSRLSPGFPWPL